MYVRATTNLHFHLSCGRLLHKPVRVKAETNSHGRPPVHGRGNGGNYAGLCTYRACQTEGMIKFSGQMAPPIPVEECGTMNVGFVMAARWWCPPPATPCFQATRASAVELMRHERLEWRSVWSKFASCKRPSKKAG